MWDQPDEVIQRELGQGEKLLWAGRPVLGLKLRAPDALLIPFSLLWGGFAIFWEVMVISSGAPWFFALWGVPFVLVGLYIMFGRFIVDAQQRAKTYYGITSERILIVSGLWARKVQSLNLDTLTDVTLTERSSGAGTISFGPISPFAWSAGTGWPMGGYRSTPTFELATEAREVYETIRTARRGATHRPN